MSSDPRAPTAVEASGPPPADAALPRATEPALLLILLLGLALQLLALSRIEGYQLADSVEYMDRAQLVARGARLDPGTVRSFAFSALLTPIFWVADRLGVEDFRPVVFLVRLAQMLLGTVAVVVTARVGARLGGRAAGLAAAFLLATNPVYLQYSVSPLSATAAMLCVVLALQSLVAREGASGAWRAGLWFGAGILMHFQVIPIAGVAALLLLLRDRGRRWWRFPALCAALGLFLAVQLVLDKLVYGSYGASLVTYVIDSGFGMIPGWLYRVGEAVGSEAIKDFALGLYDRVHENTTGQQFRAKADIHSLQDTWWYFSKLTTACLAWPAAVLVGLGLVRSMLRRSWLGTLLLVELAVNVYLLSTKGSKSFRLWMPLLPPVAILGGWGWELLRGRTSGLARRAAAWLLLAVSAWLGVGILQATNLAKYGGYWRAMERVNAAAAESASGDAGDAPPTVASAYHWAVRFRDAADVALVKLPFPLDRWDDLDEAQRGEVLATLEHLDWFLGHLQVIVQDPRIVEVLNRRMEVADVIWDEAAFEDLEPVYVLRPRTGDPDARTFFDLLEVTPPSEVQPQLQHQVSVDFRRVLEDGVRQMVLLGYEVETGLADGTLAWLTTWWYAGPLAGHDYTVTTRVTFGDASAEQQNHAPTWNVHPTSTWEEGWIVREGLLVKVPADPLGIGPHARGDLVPARLWMAVVEYAEVDGEVRQVGGLAPWRPSGANPVHRVKAEGGLRGFASDDGRTWSVDGLYLVGGFWLPVPPEARRADDGRPLERAARH